MAFLAPVLLFSALLDSAGAVKLLEPPPSRKPPWQHRQEAHIAARKLQAAQPQVEAQGLDTWLARFKPFAGGPRALCHFCAKPVFLNGDDFFCAACNTWVSMQSALDPMAWRERFSQNYAAINAVFGSLRQSGHLFEALHEDFQPGPRARGGPGPQTNIQWLLQLAFSGGDPEGLLNQVGHTRITAALADQSLDNYRRYMQSVAAFMAIFDLNVAPAPQEKIYQFCAVVDNDNTLRGFLAAWRFFHLVVGALWPVENDTRLKFLQKGTANLMTVQLCKKAIRKKAVCGLISYWVKQEMWLWAAVAALAYIFLLRVPSEFFRQSGADKWRVTPDLIAYGPIRRKGHRQPQTITRRCCCRQTPLLCPHKWVQVLEALAGPGWGGPFPAAAMARFSADLKVAAADLGWPDPDAYATHAFRRGAAQDVLAQDGLATLLWAGGWSGDARAALAYVSRDQVEQRLVGEVLLAGSDDEA